METCEIGLKVEGSERVIEADLCFLAMGFLGPEAKIAEELEIECDPRSNYQAKHEEYTTNKVFSLPVTAVVVSRPMGDQRGAWMRPRDRQIPDGR